MLSNKQLKLFDAFVRTPFTAITRKDIKTIAKEKSNNAVFLAIKSYKEEDLITEEIIGNTGLLKLNLNNNLAILYVELCNHYYFSEEINKTINKLIAGASGVSKFYSIIIFGSCAIDSKGNDLDVAIITQEEDKKLQAALNSLITRIRLDLQFITAKEFVKMLTNSEENLGKQIVRKHRTVCNSRIFYELVKEGINNGFRI